MALGAATRHHSPIASFCCRCIVYVAFCHRYSTIVHCTTREYSYSTIVPEYSVLVLSTVVQCYVKHTTTATNIIKFELERLNKTCAQQLIEWYRRCDRNTRDYIYHTGRTSNQTTGKHETKTQSRSPVTCLMVSVSRIRFLWVVCVVVICLGLSSLLEGTTAFFVSEAPSSLRNASSITKNGTNSYDFVQNENDDASSSATDSTAFATATRTTADGLTLGQVNRNITSISQVGMDDSDANVTNDHNITTSIVLEQTALKYESAIQSLRNSTLKYYVYDDPPFIHHVVDRLAILKEEEPYIFNAFLQTNGRDTTTPATSASSMSTWRVTDPTHADLFIVPTALIEYSRMPDAIDAQMVALTNHTIFQQTHGHRHVLFALEGRYFDGGSATKYAKTKQFNSKWVPRLQNVTVVMNYDPITCYKLSHPNTDQPKQQQDHGDWNEFFATVSPLLRYAFSIGLVAGSSLPVVPASYERFQTMTYTLFYHTRTHPSVFGSTPYRWAPLNVTLPYNASIGFDLPPDQWLERMTSSKFCLVIRGDTPNSHALLRAVKVGCIPVVVCDYYPIFSPTLKTSLSIQDFSIFLDETDFLKNPQQLLASLDDLSELEIRTKLIALQYAQQVTCPDHPDSLFLPAFLREAHASFQPTYQH